MATFDIFNNDAFSLSSLSQVITDLPRVPTKIGSSGLFQEYGINSLTMMIERRGAGLSLVPTAPRGGVPQPIQGVKRKLIPVSGVHLPQTGGLDADEVQGIRAFGSESEVEAVATAVARKAGYMKANLDVTLERHRLGAIMGQVLDADDSVLLDMYDLFGMTQQTVPFNIATAGSTTDIKASCQTVTDIIEDAMGGKVVPSIHAYVSRDFFAKLTGHSSMKTAWERWQNGQYNREQQDRNGFSFGGITFEVYGGGVNGVSFLPSGTGFAFPMGVMGMFQTAYCPANFMETVNTNGLPYYLKQQVRPWQTGVDLYSQSNPINLNCYPEAVVKLKASAT